MNVNKISESHQSKYQAIKYSTAGTIGGVIGALIPVTPKEISIPSEGTVPVAPVKVPKELYGRLAAVKHKAIKPDYPKYVRNIILGIIAGVSLVGIYDYIKSARQNKQKM
jgi:hypothetical protein